MKGWVKCKQATVLSSRAMDGRLPWMERMALRIHLAICGNCSRFAAQLRMLRELMHKDGGDAANDSCTPLSDAARERIAKVLQKKP